MGSQQSTVDFIVEQIAGAGDVSARKMFGEYAVYCDGKVVALVCDDCLFVKPTDAGRRFIGTVTERPAFPKAKPSFLIAADKWDDADWMADLIRKTWAELPMPKPKKKRQKV